MDSDILNDRIRELENKDAFFGGPMAKHGKALPYIGWFWRTVDFDQPITLGDCGGFIGFMENNKWGYEEWVTTPEQSATIRQLVDVVVTNPGPATLQSLFDFVQGCKPDTSDGG